MTRGKDLGPRPKRDNKATMRKKMKLEMLRYCLVWGYGEAQTIAYFKQRDEELSHSHYYELKAEFNSEEGKSNWYREQALVAMENTHKQSIEQLDELIKTTMSEIQQLQSTNVYVNKGSPEKPDLILNENHDPSALAMMMKTLSDLIKTRDDMLAATPVVQAILNEQALKMSKEKMIKN